MFKRVTQIAMLAGRLALGFVLVFCTTFVAGLIGKLSLERGVPLGSRLLLVLLSLFFALQSYAVFRILIFRRRVGRSSFNFRPPGASPDWPLGKPVPVRPPGPWLVRAAAQALPHDE
jgi:hypothetical protein